MPNELDNVMIFNRNTETRKEKDGSESTTASKPVSKTDAINYFKAYSDEAPRLFVKNGSEFEAVTGFVFDVSDIQTVVKDLVDEQHQMYIGFAKNENSHTLIVGAVEVTRDANGIVTARKFIIDINRPMYDYCDPCPPATPTFI